MVRKLNLSDNNAMILASKLKSVNVLAPGVKVTASQAYCIDVAGVLNGPDIRRLMKDQGFLEILDATAAVAWDAVRALFKHVLYKNRSPEYANFIANLMESFDAFEVHMSLKIHMLHSEETMYDSSTAVTTSESSITDSTKDKETKYDSSTDVTTDESSSTVSTEGEESKYDSSTNVTTRKSPVTDSTTDMNKGAGPTPPMDSANEYEMNQRRYYDEANRRLEANIQSLLNQTGLSEVKRTDLSDVLALLYKANASTDSRIKKFAYDTAFQAIIEALN
ncbi:uncharacterized protein LOC118746504 [Rhagoletis pomonella]|uniref:uncharacterized protein LOC118746504 n=1 Tax=Rhagoletis pomonella TaxID=28610 RepID=UPI0017874733|nr:uncharacterized protein LOC118746504 [Rhagoletis pomonella]